MSSRISIIGGGRWGRALHTALSEHQPTIVSRRELGIPSQVFSEEALRSELLIIAISAQHLRGWLEQSFHNYGQKILVASKGIEAESGALLNSVCESYISAENLAYLAGPSFAAEVEQGLPTAMSIHSHDLACAETFAELFPSFIKCYTDTDVIGGEVAGAYKNVIAIAAGICDGLNLGNNAKAALVARGLVEITRFAVQLGAKSETFLGLAGAGDLFLTCNSPLSRNYRVGQGLAMGKKLAEILEELGETAEGVATTQAILTLSDRHSIYTPIADEVWAILDGKDPKQSLYDLLK